jgi:hypothetical protein
VDRRKRVTRCVVHFSWYVFYSKVMDREVGKMEVLDEV